VFEKPSPYSSPLEGEVGRGGNGYYERKIMSAKTIYLIFDGYWPEHESGKIPTTSGIYVVYEGAHDPAVGGVAPLRVLYIGSAENVQARITGHEKWSEWRRQCQLGSLVYFSFAPIIGADLERAEAALIYKHKPPVNEKYTKEFPFCETTINLEGQCISAVPEHLQRRGKTVCLEKEFTVFQTD